MVTTAMRTLAFGVTCVCLVVTQPASALDYQLGDISATFTGAVTLGTSLRLLNQSSDLVANPGSGGFLSGLQSTHAGDLNYNAGDFISGYAKANSEVLIKLPDDFKIFVRGEGIYDPVSPNTEFVPLSKNARDAVAQDFKLLDLWASKEFELDGHNGRLRVGNQAINWGESLFVAGGINSNNPLDLQRLTIPGVPLKEVFLPSPSADLSFSPAQGLNIEGYYQFRWVGNREIPAGSYFSVGDYIGPGRIPLWFSWDPRYAAKLLGGISTTPGGPLISNPRAAETAAEANGYSFFLPNGQQEVGSPLLNDVSGRNSGEFGISVHYKPSEVPIDFGVYYQHYSDKNPYLTYVPTPGIAAGFSGQFVYPRGESLIGVSLNFPIGDWAIGFESSYHPNDPILVDPFTCGDLNGGGPSCNGNYATFRYTDRLQTHLTWWRTVNPNAGDYIAQGIHFLGAQASNIQGEFVEIHYPGVHQTGVFNGLGLLPNITANFAVPGQGFAATHFGTAESMGAIAYFDLTYDDTIIPAWQVIPSVTFSYGISGDTPNENYSWFEGTRSTAISLLFNKVDGAYSAQLEYVTYGGGDPTYLRNYYKDRDYVSVSVTRNF